MPPRPWLSKLICRMLRHPLRRTTVAYSPKRQRGVVLAYCGCLKNLSVEKTSNGR